MVDRLPEGCHVMEPVDVPPDERERILLRILRLADRSIRKDITAALRQLREETGDHAYARGTGNIFGHSSLPYSRNRLRLAIVRERERVTGDRGWRALRGEIMREIAERAAAKYRALAAAFYDDGTITERQYVRGLCAR